MIPEWARDKGEPCAECFEKGWPVPDDYELPEKMIGVMEVQRCEECGWTVLVDLSVEKERDERGD